MQLYNKKKKEKDLICYICIRNIQKNLAKILSNLLSVNIFYLPVYALVQAAFSRYKDIVDSFIDATSRMRGIDILNLDQLRVHLGEFSYPIPWDKPNQQCTQSTEPL